MATKNSSETGIRVNLANFSKILDSVQALGARYQPAEPALSGAALGTSLAGITASVNSAEALSKPYQKYRADRAELFSRLRPLSTRVANAVLILREPSEGIKKEVAALNRKIQGRRAPGASTEAAVAAQPHSSAQTGFVNLAGHLRALIALLDVVPQYRPLETELSLNGLRQLADDLDAANDAVSRSYMPYSNALAERNALFNLPSSGIIDLAQDVKKYYKAAFGGTSPEYKQISGIELKRVSE